MTFRCHFVFVRLRNDSRLPFPSQRRRQHTRLTVNGERERPFVGCANNVMVLRTEERPTVPYRRQPLAISTTGHKPTTSTLVAFYPSLHSIYILSIYPLLQTLTVVTLTVSKKYTNPFIHGTTTPRSRSGVASGGGAHARLPETRRRRRRRPRCVLRAAVRLPRLPRHLAMGHSGTRCLLSPTLAGTLPGRLPTHPSASLLPHCLGKNLAEQRDKVAPPFRMVQFPTRTLRLGTRGNRHGHTRNTPGSFLPGSLANGTLPSIARTLRTGSLRRTQVHWYVPFVCTISVCRCVDRLCVANQKSLMEARCETSC